jgi:hypothetical protein
VKYLLFILVFLSSGNLFVSKNYRDDRECRERLIDIRAHLDVSDGNEAGVLIGGDRLVREGFLEKTNRDGVKKLYFILTNATLTTCSEDIGITSSTRLQHNRTIPLESLIVG